MWKPNDTNDAVCVREDDADPGAHEPRSWIYDVGPLRLSVSLDDENSPAMWVLDCAPWFECLPLGDVDAGTARTRAFELVRTLIEDIAAAFVDAEDVTRITPTQAHVPTGD